MFKHRGLYVALGMVGALVVLMGSVGVAYAQGPQPPVAERPFYRSDTCDGSGSHGPAGRMGGGMVWGMSDFSLVDATAEVTGLTVDEVVAFLEEGQTFAEIAEAQGVTPQAIVDAFLADREAALEQAVADGRLTQEQADQMLEEMAEHVSEHLEQPWTSHSFDGDRMGQGSFGRGAQTGAGFAPRFSPRHQ
jgi:hypothetical protein